MKISVYVITRNEAANIVGCLQPLVDLFDDIVVVDGGSTDGTPEIIKEKLGIKSFHLDASKDASFAVTRNYAISLTRHPWVLKIDADERLSRAHAQRLLDLENDTQNAGYFCVWRTFIGDTVIEDYKLPLARRVCIESGLFHENLQQDMRRKGLHAAWLPGVQLLHYPDVTRLPMKTIEYREKLLAAIAREPQWYRYYWFLGYMDYQAGDYAMARSRFKVICDAQPKDFPVECMNSYMALTDIAAREGNAGIVIATLKMAQTFYAQVQDDFEVKVNFRVADWLEQAMHNAGIGELEAVRAYLFAK